MNTLVLSDCGDPALAYPVGRAWKAVRQDPLGCEFVCRRFFTQCVPVVVIEDQMIIDVAKYDVPHTRDAACRSQTGVTFEITPELHGTPVLFDFMGPGDVLDVLISVGTRLLPERPWPSRAPAVDNA